MYKHLVNPHIDQHKSGKEKQSLEVTPFAITPIQNNSDKQQNGDIEVSSRAYSGIHSSASSIQSSPRSPKSSPNEIGALFLLPQLQPHVLPMNPMPRQPPELPNPTRGSQPSKSNTPPSLASATDKGKIAHFATKV